MQKLFGCDCKVAFGLLLIILLRGNAWARSIHSRGPPAARRITAGPSHRQMQEKTGWGQAMQLLEHPHNHTNLTAASNGTDCEMRLVCKSDVVTEEHVEATQPCPKTNETIMLVSENKEVDEDLTEEEVIEDIRGEDISALGGDDRSSPQMAMLFLFVMLFIGCVTRFGLEYIQATLNVRIPSSAMLLMIGVAIGSLTWREIIASDGEPDELLTVSLMMWTWMDPRLILFMFLPALIFEGGMSTDYFIFQNQFPGGIMLAGPGMLIQIFLIAMWAMYAFPYGWGLTESLLFGSILSATDPVAVIGLMKELALLSDLRVLIEAESLLNDGTAIVVFELCLMVLLEPTSIFEYVATGFQLVLGAPLLGLGLFLGMRFWLQKTADPIQDTIVTVITAYLCYFLAEAGGCNVSGVLSVLTVGILMAGFGHTAIKTDEATHMLHAFWTLLCWAADTIIFVLAGVIIVQDGFLSHQDVFRAQDWGYLFALYLSLLIIRSLMIFVCCPVLRCTGYGMQPRVCSRERFAKYMCILSWGGLRGAVGLVLAVVVSMDKGLAAAVSDEVFCTRVLCHVAGIVVLTTIINAATLEPLIIWFGLVEFTDTEVQIMTSSSKSLSQKNADFVHQFQNRHEFPDLASVDWDSVDSFVGFKSLLPDVLLDKLSDENAMKTVGSSNQLERTMSQDQMEMYLRGRYLMALRCSYANQSQIGLLSGLAYRQISWAINTALDHVNDEPALAEKLSADLKNFEWGWLVGEGFLDLPSWLKKSARILRSPIVKSFVSNNLLDRFSSYLTRRQHARRMEILLSVARAHGDTLRSECDLYGAHVPLCAEPLLRESRCIKTKAENEYAYLRRQMPDIASAVHTRQTCQLVLSDFEEQIAHLHNTTQLSDKDFDGIRKEILSKKRRLLYHLPPRTDTHADSDRNDKECPRTRRLCYYFSKAASKSLASLLSEEIFEQSQEVLSGSAVADSLYIIDRGMVRLGSGAVEQDIGMVGSALSSPDSADTGEPTHRHTTLLGDGCCINDSELLLVDAGFETYNVDSVQAVTKVKAFRLQFKHLSLHPEQHINLLQTVWRQAGNALCNRCPELFDYVTPSADFRWSSVRLMCFQKENSFVVHGPALLVQGSLRRQRSEIALRSSVRRSARSKTRKKKEMDFFEPFKYFSPAELDGFIFTVDSETCKLVLSKETSCDMANRVESFFPTPGDTPEGGNSPMCALKPSKPSSDCYLTHEDEEAGASNLADSLISDTAQLETRAVHDVENEAQLPSWSAVKRLQRPIQEITSLISISKDHRSSHDRSSLVWRNINSSVGAHQDSDVPAMSSWKEFQAEGGDAGKKKRDARQKLLNLERVQEQERLSPATIREEIAAVEQRIRKELNRAQLANPPVPQTGTDVEIQEKP